MFKAPRIERVPISAWACKDVNDIYERIARVGSGTYGEVDKACLKSNRENIVALKKIKDENETEGFPITALREINILQSLNHPNIVKLIDVVTSKASKDNKRKRGSTYLVFEYMEHELLGLIDRIKFEPAQIKCIMKQILQGLYYLDQNNILHRDIKGANILINNKGEVKLADFGLAKRITTSGNLTPRVVTRWYRAPEILLGSRKYTTKIDIWAAGCVFVELLLGVSQAIFPAPNTPSQFDMICSRCGVPDNESWPGYKSLGNYANMIPKQDYPRVLIEYMRKRNMNLDEYALDLLDKMLVLNPDSRINAKEALEHPYFYTQPLPCELTGMPKIEKEHHDLVLKAERKQQQEQHQQQQQQQYMQNVNQNLMKSGQARYGGGVGAGAGVGAGTTGTGGSMPGISGKYYTTQQQGKQQQAYGGDGAGGAGGAGGIGYHHGMKVGQANQAVGQYQVVKSQVGVEYQKMVKGDNVVQGGNVKVQSPNQSTILFTYNENPIRAHSESTISNSTQARSDKLMFQYSKRYHENDRNANLNYSQSSLLSLVSNQKASTITNINTINNNNSNNPENKLLSKRKAIGDLTELEKITKSKKP